SLRRLRPGATGDDDCWLRDLLRANPGRDEIAALAPAVFEAAEGDDTAANDILTAAAAELAGMTRAVHRALGSEPLPISWSGSVIDSSADLRRRVHEHLSQAGRLLEWIAPGGGPVEGALHLAYQALRSDTGRMER